MSLCGTGQGHCCWLGEAGACPYVEPSPEEGYNWRCSLRAARNSWEEVHLSAEYIADVKPNLIAIGYPTTDCGDWPIPGMTCKECGEIGQISPTG